MKKQYIIQKYVMAENVAEAIRKSKKAPITEVYIHNSWLEKNKEFNIFENKTNKIGFKSKK